ncbi:MAG: DUF2799 domain-containing protein [Bdellovibrionia bacterium]
MRLLFLAVVLLFNSGCASYFLKKRCEETNWFEYGEKIALSGKRLDEDTFVQQCRKEEAEVKESLLDRGFKKGLDAYCRPDTAYRTGRNGQFFEKSMCQGINITETLKKYNEGVATFCQAENAYQHGLNGNSYNGVCPSSLETEFKKNYNSGRKKYLQGQLVTNEHKLEVLKDKERRVRSQLSSKEGELRGLSYVNAASAGTNPELIKLKERLESEVNSLRYEESKTEKEYTNLQSEIGRIKAELVQLGD